MTNNPLAALRDKVAKRLEGFSPDPSRLCESQALDQHRPEASEFPVPELVLFALRDVMGFRWAGHGEKVRWSVYCLFKGVPLIFELQKFGFTILYGEGVEGDLKRICGQLQVALKCVEKALDPIAHAQVSVGNVTIANRFSEFEGRYRFFRARADAAYKRSAAKPKPPSKAAKASADDLIKLGIEHMMAGCNAKMTAGREGFFYSTATVDAYFSRLEHQLALCLAFAGKPLKDGELVHFLTDKWDTKIRRFLDVTGDRICEITYAKLKRIKERIRNPFAHGGVENDYGSLFIHIPSLGALPANFTRIKDSIRFNFIPIEADDHMSACDVFDKIDALLAVGPMEPVFELINAGIDPQFDADTLKVYAGLVAGPKQERQDYIDMWHHQWSTHANMDY